MSPALQQLFVSEIMPVIAATVPRVVRTVGAEDAQELVQDTLADACVACESLERRGQDVIPKSVAYYAVQRAKSGRRCGQSGRTDAMSVGAQLDGKVSFVSLDQEIVPDDSGDGDVITLHDALATQQDDPATRACRHLDWGGYLPLLTEQQRATLAMTAANYPVTEIAEALRVSSPRVVAVKHEAAEKARRHWGDRVIQDAATVPGWRRDLDRRQQRHHVAG